jgi:excisionase family DNA binding protein
MEAATLIQGDQAQASSPLVLTVAEAARLLACSRSQIYGLCNAGEIASIKLGKSGVRIPYANLIAFINAGGVVEASAASRAARVRSAGQAVGSSSSAWR